MKRAASSVSSAAAVTLRAQQGSAMMERVSETLRYLNSVQHSPSPSRSSVSSSSLKPSTNPSGRRQQTLADLASQAPSTREVSAAAHSSDHHHQFNYAERRAAQYYADTIRTLIFSCHYLSTSQFQCLQPQVSAALLTSTPTMSAISSERKEMHALGQELRRGNAMAYFSLLLRHRLPPVNYEDYKNMTQCLMVRRASKGGGGGDDDDDDTSVVASSSSSIPVSPNTYPHIHASWEHSLALLSWAMMLNSGDRALPPSIADITNVLDSLTFHSGSRSSEGKPDSAMHTNRSDDSAVEKVKQLLDAAVQRRHACSSSSDATTSPSSSPLQAEIHTLGKKVHVTEPSSSSSSSSSGQDVLPSSVLSHSPNLASEFLLKGQWECVLQAFSDMLSSLSGSTTTTTGSVKMTQGLVQASFSPRFLHRRLHDDETHHREVTKIIRAYSNNPREQQKQIRAYILRSAISCVIAHAASRVRAANNNKSNSNSSTNTNSAESKQDTIMTKLKELLRELKPLSFIVPETKLPGFYFKWLYRDTFVASYHRHHKTESDLSASSNNASVACCYTESSWNSPLGLLGGRCFRITSHLPSHARQEGRHPCKMVRYVLDTQRVVEHFLNAQEELHVVEQQQQQGTALHTKRNETPNVVVSFSSPEDDASGVCGGDEEREGEGRECGGLCVVYKPAGVASTLHASAPSVTAYLTSCTSSDCNIPSWATTVTDGGDDDNDVVSHFAQEGLVNRIDRNTSGLLLAARDEATLFAMRRHGIAEREARKSYIALVVHCPPSDRSLLTLCGSRTPGSCAFFLLPRGVIGGKVFAEGCTFGLTMSEAQRVGGGGARSSSFDRREAVTEYTVLESFPHRRISLVRAVIRSGRRHQIRQHFASIHHPLVGDVQYHPRAAADDLIDRVALHAEEVCIDVRLANQNVRDDEEGDPLACRRKVVVTCDLPVDMEQALRSLRAEKRRLRR